MTATANLAVVNARIGDTLLVTPALRAIKARWPDRELVVRAHRERAPLLAGLPFIDRVEPLRRQALRIIDAFAGRRYRNAFCWSDDPALVAYCRRVSTTTVAFGDPRGGAADFVAVGRPDPPVHAVDERLLLAAALGATTADKRLAYVVLPEERARARRWLAERGAANAERVGLQPASYPGKAYRDWPLAHFDSLVGELLGWRHSLFFVVLGDAASRASAARLAQAHPGRVVDATGSLSLRETAAVMSELRLYVGVDTGPTHLAGALGVPMVALYHCFHRGRLLAPLGHPALAVVEHPCSDSRCTRETPMSEVAVETVLASCVELLSKPDPRALASVG